MQHQCRAKKRSSGDSRFICYLQRVEKNSCFIITKWKTILFTALSEGPTGRSGGIPYIVQRYGLSEAHPTRAVSEEATQEAIIFNNRNDNPSISGYGIELLKCSGAE